MRTCPDCHKVVTALDAVEIDGKFYHKSCRICYKCGKVIRDDFFHPKQEKSKEADYLIQWILEENKDPVYGDGFRLMKKRLEKLGWKGLMDALLWEDKAPEHIYL